MATMIFEGFIITNVTKFLGKPAKKMLESMNVDGDIVVKGLTPDYEFTVERDTDWMKSEIELIRKGIEDKVKTSGVIPKHCEFYVKKRESN
jgi:hypothetical protein